jgi:hypothetical protein
MLCGYSGDGVEQSLKLSWKGKTASVFAPPHYDILLATAKRKRERKENKEKKRKKGNLASAYVEYRSTSSKQPVKF